MEKTREKTEETLQGGRYARSEDELFDKAIALLDKCKMMTRPSGREKLGSTVRSS